jgi:hypothetical protein
MYWIKQGFFAIIGGFAAYVLAFRIFMATGNYCGIGGMVWAILIGVPIGNVAGIVFYRKHFLKTLTTSDALCAAFALPLSALGALSSIYVLNDSESLGVIALLLAPCFGSLFGYSIGLRIMKRHRRDTSS